MLKMAQFGIVQKYGFSAPMRRFRSLTFKKGVTLDIYLLRNVFRNSDVRNTTCNNLTKSRIWNYWRGNVPCAQCVCGALAPIGSSDCARGLSPSLPFSFGLLHSAKAAIMFFIIYKDLVIADRYWVGFLRNRFALSAFGILGDPWVGMRLRRIIAKCPIILTHIWAPGFCANI